MTIDKLLKTIRKQLGLSQEAFARALSIATPTVSRWENGKFTPTGTAETVLKAYCKEHGIKQDLIDAIDTAESVQK